MNLCLSHSFVKHSFQLFLQVAYNLCFTLLRDPLRYEKQNKKFFAYRCMYLSLLMLPAEFSNLMAYTTHFHTMQQSCVSMREKLYLPTLWLPSECLTIFNTWKYLWCVCVFCSRTPRRPKTTQPVRSTHSHDTSCCPTHRVGTCSNDQARIAIQ